SAAVTTSSGVDTRRLSGLGGGSGGRYTSWTLTISPSTMRGVRSGDVPRADRCRRSCTRRYREASRLRRGLRFAAYGVSGSMPPSLLELGDKLLAVVEQDHLGSVVAGDQVQLPVSIDVCEANGDHDQVSVGPGQHGQEIELWRVSRRVA